MGYITPEYYNDTYKGLDAGDELEKFILRASDAIDQVTGYKLKNKPFEEQPQFVQEQVKKAVATQVEFYVVQGGDAEINAGAGELERVRVGHFDYSTGSNGSDRDVQRVSPATISLLSHTGLLYAGMGVIQNAFY